MSTKKQTKQPPLCGATNNSFRDGKCIKLVGHKGFHQDTAENTWARHFPIRKEPQPRCVIANDKVPTDWADGKEGVTVEQWGQREFDSGRNVGLTNGLLIAHTHLIKRATELFKEGNDAEAIKLRNLAVEIKDLE